MFIGHTTAPDSALGYLVEILSYVIASRITPTVTNDMNKTTDDSVWQRCTEAIHMMARMRYSLPFTIEPSATYQQVAKAAILSLNDPFVLWCGAHGHVSWAGKEKEPTNRACCINFNPYQFAGCCHGVFRISFACPLFLNKLSCPYSLDPYSYQCNNLKHKLTLNDHQKNKISRWNIFNLKPDPSICKTSMLTLAMWKLTLT